MENKVLPKKQLDDVVRVLRKRVETGDEDFYGYAIALAQKLPNGQAQWINYLNLLNAMIGVTGFVPNATNADIYQVLIAIGFEVQDEQSA